MHYRSCRISTLQLLAGWTICQILIRIRLCRLPKLKCARQCYLSQPVPQVGQMACVPNISKI